MLKKVMILGILASNISAYSYKVSICKVVEHEALNAVERGIEAALAKEKDVEYAKETSQVNPALAAQIMSKFANNKSDVVVTIGTTPTQVAFTLAKEKKIKLVFSSVTDPASISTSLANTNTTGVSNFVDLKPQIELFRKIQPKLKKLGMLYNTGDSNSVVIVKRLKEVLKEMGIELIEQGIQKSADIPQAIGTLSKKVDAVFISNDNTALGGMSLIVKTCMESKIPVYVSDTDQVEAGCLAALGPNQYEIGIQTGKMIEKIKKGEDINNIKIEYPTKTELFVNAKATRELGIVIPKEVLDQAKNVIRLPSKASASREFKGAYGTQNRSVYEIHEDSSTGATKKLPEERRFRGKSNGGEVRKP